MNPTAVLRGRVITPDLDIADGVVEVGDTTILAVRAATPDDVTPATSEVIVPGLVDIHCHGGAGASFTSADAAATATAAEHHLRHGTTSLLGGLVTDSPERLLAGVAVLADAVEAGALAGIFLEGPFLSAARCGAQDPRHLLPPDPGLAHDLLTAGRGHVRLMTVAPELPGADDVARVLAEHGARVAVGHTEAPAALTHAFLAAHQPAIVTHLFNGMAPLHHREPGAAMGALRAAARGDAVVELIADGVHLDDETVAGVLALLGSQRAAFVTDAMAAAGMADGTYWLGPQEVVVADGVARLPGGGSIAGGTSRLCDVVARQVAAGVSARDVVTAATATPAAAIGLSEAGLLRVGDRADVVVFDSDWAPRRVMQAGRWVS